MNKRLAAAALAATLAVPAAAVAHPGNPDHGKHEAGKGKHAEKHTGHVHKHGSHAKKPKAVTFVFKGVFTAPGTVAVQSGNAHVRKGGFVGQSVSFDVTSAKVVVADTNGDSQRDVADVKDGDMVLVQARVARKTRYAAPAEGETAEALVARKLIDRTNAPVENEPESESESESPAS
jgi:hypothetical protein